MTGPLRALALLALLVAAGPAAAAEQEPEPTPTWSAALRAGVIVLRSPSYPGVPVEHPVGPDLELSLGRTLYEFVSLEVNAGAYTTKPVLPGTRLTVFPFSVSLKVTAAPDFGFEGYAVVGLGASVIRLKGASATASTSTQPAYHAGLGVRRRFGEALFAGVEGRYVFLNWPGGPGVPGRLDGTRLSALVGTLF